MDCGSKWSDLKSQHKSFWSERREDCPRSIVLSREGGQETGEGGELAAPSLALTSVLRQRGEKVPAFVRLFASGRGREGGGRGALPPARLRVLCATQQVWGEALLPGWMRMWMRMPCFFHGHSGNQSEAAFLNSRPVIPGNKWAQEGAVGREWGWFGNSSAGPLLI